MIKCLAIIPARGGSKRIPRKNIKEFAGQPIIKYSIDAAKKSQVFDEIMVSTDDKEIAKIGKLLGAKVPFLRSPKNSDDKVGTAPVLEEVIREYEKIGKKFDYICCIYPTNPFITAENLRAAYEIISDNNKIESVAAVYRIGHPIQKALKLRDGKIEMIFPGQYFKRTQDLETFYHDSNQFYFLKTKNFLKQKKLYLNFTSSIEVSESEAQDINNEEDWKMAESKFRLLKKRK